MGTTYDISITAINNAAPADGFIDPTTAYTYMDRDGDSPATLAAAKAKFRANMRYLAVISQITQMCNFRVLSVTPTGADADTPPTTLTMQIEVENDGHVITEDEDNLGVYLTGAAAIERCVARAMISSKARAGDYYDPTATQGRDVDGAASTPLPKGIVSAKETIGALAADLATAEAAVTVTPSP